MICTTQQGKSAKQTKRYLFDAELSLLIIRKFGSHEAFSESTLSYRRSQYVISIFFETIMIREFLLYMQPKNPKIIITKLSSVYVNSYMFFQFLQLLEAARSLQLFADISAWHTQEAVIHSGNRRYFKKTHISLLRVSLYIVWFNIDLIKNQAWGFWKGWCDPSFSALGSIIP